LNFTGADLMSVVSRATYEVQDAWFYLSNGYYAEVSLWVWVFIGVTLYWIFRRRRSRYRGPGRTRSAQLKKAESRGRHKQWKKEAVVVLRQIKQSKLSGDAIQGVMQSMSPYAFEYLITEGLRKKGAPIRKLQRVVADGGIDGMVRFGAKWHVIQAKRYAAPVSAGMISEFLQLCSDKRMPGLFVASNGFTEPAIRFARKNGRITLVDSQKLVSMIR
jgi:restriction endonuclease Mrr